jgi:hypothetical protein
MSRGGESIPNYLVHSILVTIFCCLPLGIVAIIFAAQVNGKVAQGDYQGARDSSSKAKTFTLIGFIAGIVAWIIVIIWYVIVFMLVASAVKQGINIQVPKN